MTIIFRKGGKIGYDFGFSYQENTGWIPGFFPLIFMAVRGKFGAQPLTETMENKLKINVIVNTPDNPIFLLTASEIYTELGFQPAIGDLLTIIPDKTHDIEAICNEQPNSKTKCLLEVYK